MMLLVGLGNPGAQYKGNRHNIGFMALDTLVQRPSFSPWRKRFQGLVSEGEIDATRVMLLKPQTFMNESGRSVGEAMRYCKIEGDRLIVFHDEIDLAPGKLRVKAGGGMAGHNGLRSIGQTLGPHFMRVRMGVGHPGHRDQVMPHVLSDFSKADHAWLDPMLAGIDKALSLLLAGDDAGFQNKVHLSIAGS